MKKHPGQSLPELLVCLATLVPALLILVGTFPFAYGLDHRAWDRLNAQEVAREQLELLRAGDFDSLTSYTTHEPRGPLDFSIDVQVAIWPPGQTNLCQKQATVSISWSSKQGTQSLQLQTLLFKWAH